MYLLWSGRESRIRSWSAQGWGWCRTRCWPDWNWSERWSYSVQWPARSTPSSPESPSTPQGGQQLRSLCESKEAAPRPLTPIWRRTVLRSGLAQTLSSPASRSVRGSSSLWSFLHKKTHTRVIHAARQSTKQPGSAWLCFNPDVIDLILGLWLSVKNLPSPCMLWFWFSLTATKMESYRMLNHIMQ